MKFKVTYSYPSAYGNTIVKSLICQDGREARSFWEIIDNNPDYKVVNIECIKGE